MPEMNDYSGPFNPNLSFKDLSKEFLIKLIHEYQHSWVILADSWLYSIKSRYGLAEAQYCECDAWCNVYLRIMPYYMKLLANVDDPSKIDVMGWQKAGQFALDGPMGYIPQTLEIISKDHVIMTMTDCMGLRHFETKDPSRTQWMCRVVEQAAMDAAVSFNPKIKVKPLKLPPRKSPDEIACQWDFYTVD